MTPSAVEELLLRYFVALDRGDVDAAADCFTDDARYSHPAYPGDSEPARRHEARGRRALEQLFGLRGPRPVDRRLGAVVVDGESAFVEGLIVEDGLVTASFVGVASLDRAEGRLSSYAAYVSRPAVWHELVGGAPAARTTSTTLAPRHP